MHLFGLCCSCESRTESNLVRSKCSYVKCTMRMKSLCVSSQQSIMDQCGACAVFRHREIRLTVFRHKEMERQMNISFANMPLWFLHKLYWFTGFHWYLFCLEAPRRHRAKICFIWLCAEPQDFVSWTQWTLYLSHTWRDTQREVSFEDETYISG